MITALTAVFSLSVALTPPPTIQGDYIEARTADVYTGPCFSNSEVFNTGHQAVMAWKVSKGSYKGVDLSGLAVVAAVQGTTTFSHDEADKAQAVLIVDRAANAEQRAALIALARELGGERLKQVSATKSALISLTVEAHEMRGANMSADAHHGPVAPAAGLWVPGLAEILTRPLDSADHVCGNEVIAYAPLSKRVDATPAFSLKHQYVGDGLNSTWSGPNRRSSFVGHFAL